MKKLLIIICLFIVRASVHDAYAQLTVGAKTGVNLNQFSQPGTLMGVNAGIYASYRLNPFLSVRFEPHYSQEGGARPAYTRFYDDVSDDIYAINFINPSVRFHNVQLPLLLELSLPELTDQTVMPVLLIGGSYAINAVAFEQHTKRYQFTEGVYYSGSGFDMPSLDVSYQRENVTSNYARGQWSIWGGVGIQFKTGERTFTFDVRYRQGLNNLNLLRFASPGNGNDIGVPGSGGILRSSSVSFNFSMSIFNF